MAGPGARRSSSALAGLVVGYRSCSSIPVNHDAWITLPLRLQRRLRGEGFRLQHRRTGLRHELRPATPCCSPCCRSPTRGGCRPSSAALVRGWRWRRAGPLPTSRRSASARGSTLAGVVAGSRVPGDQPARAEGVQRRDGAAGGALLSGLPLSLLLSVALRSATAGVRGRDDGPPGRGSWCCSWWFGAQVWQERRRPDPGVSGAAIAVLRPVVRRLCTWPSSAPALPDTLAAKQAQRVSGLWWLARLRHGPPYWLRSLT